MSAPPGREGVDPDAAARCGRAGKEEEMTGKDMIARVREGYDTPLPESTLYQFLEEAEAEMVADDPLQRTTAVLPVGEDGKIVLPERVYPYMVLAVQGYKMGLGLPLPGVAGKCAAGVFLPPAGRPEQVVVTFRTPAPNVGPDTVLTAGEGHSGCYLYYLLAKLELLQGNIGGYNNFAALLESARQSYRRQAVGGAAAERFHSELHPL